MSTKRKSPLESSTLYPVGFKKIGLDGNKWEVVKTSSGIHRWKKVSEAPKRKTMPIKKQLKGEDKYWDIIKKIGWGRSGDSGKRAEKIAKKMGIEEFR